MGKLNAGGQEYWPKPVQEEFDRRNRLTSSAGLVDNGRFGCRDEIQAQAQDTRSTCCGFVQALGPESSGSCCIMANYDGLEDGLIAFHSISLK